MFDRTKCTVTGILLITLAVVYLPVQKIFGIDPLVAADQSRFLGQLATLMMAFAASIKDDKEG